jgi:hypothetical protein
MAKAIKIAIIAAVSYTGGAAAAYFSTLGMTAGLAGSFLYSYSYGSFHFCNNINSSVIGNMTSKGIDASSANFGS